jgi:hypothetical protein
LWREYHETILRDEKSLGIPIVCEKKRNMMQIRQGLQKRVFATTTPKGCKNT